MSIHAINSQLKFALDFLGPKFDTPEARVLLLATGLQESRFEHRKQINGPAVSFFQFERIAIRELIQNNKTREMLFAFLETYFPSTENMSDRAIEDFIYRNLQGALESTDMLACLMARLNYWINPRSLPPLKSPMAAWDYYLKTWRPGKPHVETWTEMYWRAYGWELG